MNKQTLIEAIRNGEKNTLTEEEVVLLRDGKLINKLELLLSYIKQQEAIRSEAVAAVDDKGSFQFVEGLTQGILSAYKTALDLATTERELACA